MKRIKVILSLLLVCLFGFQLTSCVAKAYEQEINVVFMYEDEFIGKATVTQFLNTKTPELSEAYIPTGYKFFGWTPLNPDEVKATDVNFKSEYIGAGKMLHWADVEKYVNNSTVVCKALMIDKNDIPREYHYVAIAWYDKIGTSGFDQSRMDKLTGDLITYLQNEGVSEEDINSILIRGYTGNVGPSCGKIMDDGDIDLMIGWSGESNVTGTGGMPEEMLLESFKTNLIVKDAGRYIHRLSDTETVIKVMEWLKTYDFAALAN